MKKVYAPKDWGKLKSNKRYALINNEVHAIRPNADFVLYNGRWRPFYKDLLGDPYLEYPDCTVFFEIKEFDKK